MPGISSEPTGDSETIVDKDPNAEAPLVSVVILNCNGKDYLLECLDSVLKTSYPRFEVLIVDNGSTDGSVEAVKSNFKSVRLIVNGANLGYAKANNIGIQYAKGEYVVLLNNDTTVSPMWLAELVKAASMLKDSILQPKILLASNPQLINTVGNRIHLLGFGLPTGAGELDEGQYDHIMEIGYASGACIFAPKKVLREVGLLDEAHFFQCEDIDLGWRARAFGFKSYLIPTSRIHHWWSRCVTWSPLKFYYLERNRLLTLLKNYETKTLVLLLPLLFITELATLLYSSFKGFIHYKILGYAELIMLRSHIGRWRHEIRGKKRVPDSVLSQTFEHDLRHLYLPRATSILNSIVKVYHRMFLRKICLTTRG